jgi:arylsulfatase A-like enzyme
MSDSRPNLVWFMVDQQRTDSLGCFGNPVVQTPTIDSLSGRGTRFTNAFVQHPVCGPSRVSQMTGHYPHTSGHRTLTHLLQPWEPNVLRQLKDSGYHVVVAGNRGDVFAPGVTEESTNFCGLLTEPDPGALGARYTAEDPEGSPMHRAFYFGRTPVPDGAPLVDSDEAVIRTAEQWIAEAAPQHEPWIMWVPLIFPHPPFCVEDPWFSMYDPTAMPAPIGAEATALGQGKARFMDAYRDIYGWGDIPDDGFGRITAAYYGMISRTDDQLRRLMEAVDRIGQAGSTGWIYDTDHGEYLGDYGLVEKWPSGLDPQLTQNPLIIALPDRPEGGVCTDMVETVDLVPTLLELANTEATHSHFGKSLVPLLDAGGSLESPHREVAFSEGGFRREDHHLIEQSGWIYEPKSRLQRERVELTGKATCARTPEWSFVHRLYEQDELYDRQADPYETTNLIGSAELADIEAEMRGRVTDWYLDTTDVIPWVPDPRFPEITHGYR